MNTQHSDTLSHYRRIASLSAEMLDKAQARQWNDLIGLWAHYRLAVEHLQGLAPLDEAQKTARRDLLIRILEDDARIRALVAPELERLGYLLGTFKRQRTVLRAYCSPPTAK